MDRRIHARRLCFVVFVLSLISPLATAQDFSGPTGFFTTPYKEGLAALAAGKVNQADRKAVLAAAEDGNAAAMVLAARSFATGVNGFAKDENKAKEWADKAAEKGAYEGLVVLGEFYEKGVGLPRRPQIAESYYERAAKAGFVLAKTRLAVFLIQTKFKTDAARAVDLLRAAHSAGELTATRILGYLYLNGGGVQKDLKQAEALFLTAAKDGDPAAARGAGLVYLTVSGPLHDPKKAELWLEKAAGLGDMEAPFFLALAYTGENGFPANPGKSDDWTKRGERFFQQAQKPLLYAVLSKRAAPYVMADGTIVHAMENAVAFEARDGSVIQYATRFNLTNFDGAKNPSSLRLDLYPCGRQKGAVDFARADSLVAGGNFVDAIIELRKQCDAEKASAWLKHRAEEGHAQLQIEYADWLRKSRQEEAVYWVILGYLRMGEDVVLCQDKSARGAPTVLLSRYRALAEAVGKFPKDRYLALYEKAAAESGRMGVAGSPAYACYHGMGMFTLRSGDASEKARQPALLAENVWPEERAKVRASVLEGVRKRTAQEKK